MKKYTLLFSTLLPIIAVITPHSTLAQSNSVNIDQVTNGQSTTCINGKCTTTGGGGHSTVCVNGTCTTTDDSNVNYESDDGHTQIYINNNTNSSVSPQVLPTGNLTIPPHQMTNINPSLSPKIIKHIAPEPTHISHHTNTPFNWRDFFHNLFSFKWPWTSL